MRAIGEVVEAHIGSDAYAALQISELQAAAGEIAERFEGDDRMDQEFIAACWRVAGTKVQL